MVPALSELMAFNIVNIFVYQGVTFHTFQNQAFSLFACISVQKSEWACGNVNMLACVRTDLLFCTPSHFSALFSAHVPTH